MPLIDLPLPELRRYAGKNPRPADFDEYWKRALAELATVDPQPELKPAAFSAKERMKWKKLCSLNHRVR